MEAKKVIKCKIVGLTKNKREAIENEYNNLQEFLQLERMGLDFLSIYNQLSVYSANKQQALRFYKKIRHDSEYPISMRKDLIQIEKKNTKVSEYWARLRVKSRRNLWIAIKPHRNFDNLEICESKLFSKNKEWWLYVTVKKEIEPIHTSNVIGIDLGIIHPATVCDLQNGKTIFYGNKLREIRGKYFYLRRKVKNKNFGDIEKRRTNDQLHKIANNIVKYAKNNKCSIVIGDVKGVRKKSKGRKFNRKLGTMTSHKLKQLIKYKAEWKGIKTEFVNEAYTSKTCSMCEQIGNRNRGLFICNCGYQDNSDRNGAINIAKRGLGYISNLGVESVQPETIENNQKLSVQ